MVLQVRSGIIHVWVAALFGMSLNCGIGSSLGVHNMKFHFEQAFVFCPSEDFILNSSPLISWKVLVLSPQGERPGCRWLLRSAVGGRRGGAGGNVSLPAAPPATITFQLRTLQPK